MVILPPSSVRLSYFSAGEISFRQSWQPESKMEFQARYPQRNYWRMLNADAPRDAQSRTHLLYWRSLGPMLGVQVAVSRTYKRGV